MKNTIKRLQYEVKQLSKVDDSQRAHIQRLKYALDKALNIISVISEDGLLESVDLDSAIDLLEDLLTAIPGHPMENRLIDIHDDWMDGLDDDWF